MQTYWPIKSDVNVQLTDVTDDCGIDQRTYDLRSFIFRLHASRLTQKPRISAKSTLARLQIAAVILLQSYYPHHWILTLAELSMCEVAFIIWAYAFIEQTLHFTLQPNVGANTAAAELRRTVQDLGHICLFQAACKLGANKRFEEALLVVFINFPQGSTTKRYIECD